MSDGLQWIRVADAIPPEGVEVRTKIHNKDGKRNVQPLIREGSLWWLPDRSVYVYYAPTHWAPVSWK